MTFERVWVNVKPGRLRSRGFFRKVFGVKGIEENCVYSAVNTPLKVNNRVTTGARRQPVRTSCRTRYLVSQWIGANDRRTLSGLGRRGQSALIGLDSLSSHCCMKEKAYDHSYREVPIVWEVVIRDSF